MYSTSVESWMKSIGTICSSHSSLYRAFLSTRPTRLGEPPPVSLLSWSRGGLVIILQPCWCAKCIFHKHFIFQRRKKVCLSQDAHQCSPGQHRHLDNTAKVTKVDEAPVPAHNNHSMAQNNNTGPFQFCPFMAMANQNSVPMFPTSLLI